jgi:hypothetical protein
LKCFLSLWKHLIADRIRLYTHIKGKTFRISGPSGFWDYEYGVPYCILPTVRGCWLMHNPLAGGPPSASIPFIAAGCLLALLRCGDI